MSSILSRTSLVLRQPNLARYGFLWTQLRYKKKKAKITEKSAVALESDAAVDLAKYENSMKRTFEGMNNSLAKLKSDIPSPSLLDGKHILS